jgi:transcriptional regulator with XRE-family HTH domain
MGQLVVLKRRRQELNMTQAQVAMATGVSQPTYQNYEAGTMAIPTANLKRLAKALKMTSEEILGRPVVAGPVQESRPSKAKPPAKQSVNDDDYGLIEWWGDVAIHFVRGEPIVLAISEEECDRLYRDLQVQPDKVFFSVSSLANQLVAVRREAVTDLTFASCGTELFGPEHDYYKKHDLRTGVWPGNDETWAIVEELTVCDGEMDRDPIVEKYGEPRVARIEMSIGLHLLENIDELVAAGEVEPDDRQRALDRATKRLAKATELANAIKWQLSNGKVRKEFPAETGTLENFWWMTEDHGPLDEQSILFSGAYEQRHWVSANNVDFISVPAHGVRAAIKKENERVQRNAAAAKKRSRNG